MSAQEVQQASDRFYQALNKLLNGDSFDMEQVWSHGPNVSTMHPLGGLETDWEKVWGGWQMASQAISGGKAEVRDLQVFALGDVGYTTGVEDAYGIIGGTTARFVARCTNIYWKEADGWKIVHHHTDISPEAAEAIQRLMAQQS